MKGSNLIVLLLGGAVVYLLVKSTLKPPVPATATASPTGGAQSAAKQDTFTSILGTIQSVFNGISSIAQTQPKSM